VCQAQSRGLCLAQDRKDVLFCKKEPKSFGMRATGYYGAASRWLYALY
jgi:hypothetical protein